MTIKEITALRKSGHLAEALKAAEEAFSQNANKYTAGALFYCFNDLYKGQGPEEAAGTIERMKTLYNDYADDKGFMQKAMTSAEKHQAPHYQQIKNAVDQAKNGEDAVKLYQQISSFYTNGELASNLYPDFGWLIYYALKITPLNNAESRKRMLFNYLKLELPKPTILHSLILAEAVKVEQNTPLLFRIRDFIRLWGLENLREDDWQQYKANDGNLLPSLVEKLIGVYVKELKTDNVEASEEFSKLVDQALEKYPSSQNMQYSKATILISQRKKEEAVSYYRNLILQSPSKFYLWQQTASLIDDIDTKLGLLSKALTLGNEEQFLGGVRLSMAELLIDKGDTSHAKYELDRYHDLYLSKGWNFKEKYNALCSQLNNTTTATDNKTIYTQYAQKADEFIYSHLPEQIAIKISEKQLDDKKRLGRKIPLWILKTQNGIIRLKKPAKFGLAPKDGIAYIIKVHNSNIVWIKPIDTIPTLNWLKEANGKIRLRTNRNGKRFAFIEDVYINEKLLAGVSDGQSVHIQAVIQDDGRWIAVSLIKLMR